jgi:hypothetical protein
MRDIFWSSYLKQNLKVATFDLEFLKDFDVEGGDASWCKVGAGNWVYVHLKPQDHYSEI